MTSGTALIYALLYPKKMAIFHQKYPNFRGFALESASPRAPNMYVTPTRFFLDIKQDRGFAAHFELISNTLAYDTLCVKIVKKLPLE